MPLPGSKTSDMGLMIVDPKVPFEHRRAMLGQLCLDDHPQSAKIVHSLLQAASAGKGKELEQKKIQELNKEIADLKAGPQRLGTYVGPMPRGNRVHVLAEDGTSVFPVVLEDELKDQLRRGDEVILDAGGKAVVDRGFGPPKTGEEATLLRRIGEDCVEVSLRDHDKFVFLASEDLIEQLDAEGAKPGCSVLICPRRRFAFSLVPQEEGVSRYMYLDRAPLPDVVIERDIGDAPAYLYELAHHVHMELTRPSIRRRYRIRRTVTKLLTGHTGTGKTLSIEGFIRRMAEINSEVVGVPAEELPSRVLRMSMDKVLSMWLGQSDKQLARFFDEAIQLYDEPFVAPDGKAYHLPVIAVGEEIEALSRVRGGDRDGIYDRIQTVALRRLDTTRPDFKDRLVIFLFTTNVPDLVDPAFMRRAGGTIERFSRLTRPRAFREVLSKHLRGLPFHSNNGFDQEELCRRVTNEISAWLFSERPEDHGQVEISLANSAEPIRKCRRDFLTGALVDRAVQQAAGEACRAEELGTGKPGLTEAMIAGALNDQIRSIVQRLNERNVKQYVDLPDGAHVTRVHRLAQASALPFEMMKST